MEPDKAECRQEDDGAMHLVGRLAEQAGTDWCFGGDSQILCLTHRKVALIHSGLVTISVRGILKKRISLTCDMSWRSEHRRK